MKLCENCCNYYEMGTFGSYITQNCKIYGSLDMDQNIRNPDTEAEKCNMYNKPIIKLKGNKYKINKVLEPFIDF